MVEVEGQREVAVVVVVEEVVELGGKREFGVVVDGGSREAKGGWCLCSRGCGKSRGEDAGGCCYSKGSSRGERLMLLLWYSLRWTSRRKGRAYVSAQACERRCVVCFILMLTSDRERCLTKRLHQVRGQERGRVR